MELFQEEKCMAINRKLREMERKIATTPDFVSKMATYNGEEDGSKPGSSVPMQSTMPISTDNYYPS